MTGCDEREKKYIGKKSSLSVDKLDNEIARLKGMAAKKMKESNKKWLNQRLHILAGMKRGAEEKSDL